jgi:homoserine dehydrogenase
LLARAAFGASIPLAAIERRGIEHLTAESVMSARKRGCAIRLVGSCRYSDDGIAERFCERAIADTASDIDALQFEPLDARLCNKDDIADRQEKTRRHRAVATPRGRESRGAVSDIDGLQQRRDETRQVEARVWPVELPVNHPLAQLTGADNGLIVETIDGTSEFIRGKGAGRWPTTEAVMADLFDLHRNLSDVAGSLCLPRRSKANAARSARGCNCQDTATRLRDTTVRQAERYGCNGEELEEVVA